MKVYIITSIGFPNGFASGNRIKCYAKALLSAGTDCEVIICRRTERYGVPPQNTVGAGDHEGIPFKYIGGTPLRGSNVLIRRFNDWADKCRLDKFLRSVLKEGDIVLSYIGFDVEYCIHLCKLVQKCGAKYVLELCEFPYGTRKETSYAIRKRRIEEKKLLPIVNGIIPISDSLKEYASQFVGRGCKFHKVPILVDYKKYDLPDRSSETEIPYIFHSGKLQDQKDGILGMFEAYGKLLRDNDIPLRFITTGNLQSSSERMQIEEIVERYQLKDKLIFVGDLSQEQIQDYLSKAMMVLSYRHDNRQIKYGFSTKLGEYMAAGKPIIITKVGEPMNWLRDGKDCIMIDADDEEALINNILRLYADADLRRYLGENARITCKISFDYVTVAQQLKEFLSTL